LFKISSNRWNVIERDRKHSNTKNSKSRRSGNSTLTLTGNKSESLNHICICFTHTFNFDRIIISSKRSTQRYVSKLAHELLLSQEERFKVSDAILCCMICTIMFSKVFLHEIPYTKDDKNLTVCCIVFHDMYGVEIWTNKIVITI
jgi:hypothetical protein